jgi:hypothetical protein
LPRRGGRSTHVKQRLVIPCCARCGVLGSWPVDPMRSS